MQYEVLPKSFGQAFFKGMRVRAEPVKNGHNSAGRVNFGFRQKRETLAGGFTYFFLL